MLDLVEIKRRRKLFDGQLSTIDIGKLIAEVEQQNAGLLGIAQVLTYVVDLEGREGMTDARFAEMTLALINTLLGHDVV